MGGANQYRATSEWPSELQTESLQWVVGSDGFLPLSGSTNQGSIVNEGGTAGLPVLHVLHEWARRPFSYTIESNKS